MNINWGRSKAQKGTGQSAKKGRSKIQFYYVPNCYKFIFPLLPDALNLDIARAKDAEEIKSDRSHVVL